MRDAMTELRGNAEKINPLCPVDLIIDHSVQVDEFGTPMLFRVMCTLKWSEITNVISF